MNIEIKAIEASRRKNMDTGAPSAILISHHLGMIEIPEGEGVETCRAIRINGVWFLRVMTFPVGLDKEFETGKLQP